MNENDNTYLFLFVVVLRVWMTLLCARHGAPERGRRKTTGKTWKRVLN